MSENKVDATPELLQAYGELFAQLLESERFRIFLDANYTLTKVIDESTKTLTFSIIENPPEIIARKLAEKMAKDRGQVEVISKKVAESVLKNVKK